MKRFSNPTIDEYEKRIRPVLNKARSLPHCDMLILHHPDQCDYCSYPEYEELHRIREDMNLRYTGMSEPNDWDTVGGFEPCPSEQYRHLSDIYAWGGNIPRKDDDDHR